MGLLDNLFKPKPESAGEKSVETTPSGEDDTGREAAQPSEATSPKISPFLAPKIYVPRSSVQIVPPTKNHAPAERTLAPVVDPAHAPKEIVLTLGDVLSRIPTHFLRPGTPDLRRELRFPAEGLAADIARGRASVFLAEIVAQCPEVFLPEADAFDDIQIRLPLQKLVEQIGFGALNNTPAPSPAVPPPAAQVPPPRPPSPASPFTPPTESAPTPPAAKAPEIPQAVAPIAEEKPASPPPASSPVPLAEEKPPLPPIIAPPTTAPAADEAQIHLSLAAIMKRCPREIIVKEVPPIGETVRVSFPFAPIERQLSTGQVEVSSLRFIAALPVDLMKCFEARAGVKVPLPLEEIFQNLPNQTSRPGIETGISTPTLQPERESESTDLDRENARLAEAILLEPMFAPVENAEPVAPEPAPTENVVLNTIFVPDVSEPIAPPAPVFVPEVQTTPVEIAESPEPENISATAELEAQLAALVAEVERVEKIERIESEVTAKVLIDESDLPPAAEKPTASVVENIPEPVAAPVEVSGFRPFVPALRPPVILQPKESAQEEEPPLAAAEPAPVPEPEPESKPELRVEDPVKVAPEVPRPPMAFQPPPESVIPQAAPVAPPIVAIPPPSSVLQRPSAPPVIEPPAPEPSFAAAHAPAAEQSPLDGGEPTVRTLHISPPQFRPFVVHAPPIVLAPAESVEAASQTTAEIPTFEPSVPAWELQEPVVADTPAPPAEIPEEKPESPPAHVSEHPHKKRDAQATPLAFPDAVSPFPNNGRVRELFPAAASLALPHVVELLAALPGIQGCVLFSRSAESQSGELPDGLDSTAIRDLTERMQGALSDRSKPFPTGKVQHLTLHAEDYSLSLFARGEACACAVHRARIFLPGVRERFAAVAEELGAAQ